MVIENTVSVIYGRMYGRCAEYALSREAEKQRSREAEKQRSREAENFAAAAESCQVPCCRIAGRRPHLRGKRRNAVLCALS